MGSDHRQPTPPGARRAIMKEPTPGAQGQVKLPQISNTNQGTNLRPQRSTNLTKRRKRLPPLTGHVPQEVNSSRMPLIPGREPLDQMTKYDRLLRDPAELNESSNTSAPTTFREIIHPGNLPGQIPQEKYDPQEKKKPKISQTTTEQREMKQNPPPPPPPTTRRRRPKNNKNKGIVSSINVERDVPTNPDAVAQEAQDIAGNRVVQYNEDRETRRLAALEKKQKRDKERTIAAAAAEERGEINNKLRKQEAKQARKKQQKELQLQQSLTRSRLDSRRKHEISKKISHDRTKGWRLSPTRKKTKKEIEMKEADELW